jgi:kynureninase
VRLAPEPIETLSERVAKSIDNRTAAVLVSKVMFESSRIVPNLSETLRACEKHDTKLLIDAYHALNVVDISLRREKLNQAYVVGGGYKYCQLGEGNCFLRYPKDSDLRPLWTGWFADFESLEKSGCNEIINYGNHGQRFAGATYDPVSHYRASRVFSFFEEMKLTPAFLREVSQRQIKLLAERFDALDLNPKLIRREKFSLETLGGFLSLVTPQAKHFCEVLRKHGVLTDYRGEYLRFGPAPYLSDEQLINAIEVLGDVANS